MWIALRQFVILLALSATGAAHRLDEYLGATQIAIAPDRIDLELRLTPGALLARSVFSTIDRDADGVIADHEAQAYAESIVGNLVLQIDGRRSGLRLVARQFPARREMEEGVGVIRLDVTGPNPSPSGGRHRLVFRNNNQAELNVFLVNALMPATETIRIERQTRDPMQQGIAIDYAIGRAWGPKRLVGVTAAVIIACTVLAIRRRTKHHE